MDDLLIDLPYSELAVLAGVIESNGSQLDELNLQGADFLNPRYGEIYDVIVAMQGSRTPIDPGSIGLQLPNERVFLWTVRDQVPHTASTEYHAELVREAAVRRRVKAAGVRIQEWSGNLDMPDLVGKSRAELDTAFGLQKRKVSYVRDTLAATVESIGQSVRSSPTPWRKLTSAIGGFRPGALYVVGARPGVGKTAVSLQMATALARHGDVAYSSLEMPERELQLRLLSQGAGIAHSMVDGSKPLPDFAREKVANWLPHAPGNIAFDDRGSVTVVDIRTQVRSVSRNGNLAGVVVDYLQLMDGTRGQKRLETITEASRQLKVMARDFDVPVIALSQLNRNAESRMDKRPAMSDLRESGSIEQDADVVILLHRDMEPRDDVSPEMEMLLAKNRHGATGLLRFDWHGEFMTLTEGY